jgi:transcription elongation factor GreA
VEGGRLFNFSPKLKKTMSKTHYLSQEGFDRLNAQLDELKTDGRSNVAKAIAEAREKGDLSENAEYDAAKDAQGLLEMKINELEKVMANARVLDASQLDTSNVTVMSKVTIRNVKVKKQIQYMLVSESEADLKAKKISVSSPMGVGLLGKAVGDIAEVTTPNGIIKFEIIDITI